MSGTLHNDLTGRRFGLLTVVKRSSDHGNGKKPVVKWLCKCDCGNVTVVKSDSLLSGHTVSCGCKKVKHGYANKERLYCTWKNMHHRCYNPNDSRYAVYGGRGIKICDDWKSDYSAFREWAMANGYADNLSIDRINVNGDYSPENCRWADNKTQANNVSRNRIVAYHGENMTMSEFAQAVGLTYSAVQHRLDNGWPIERIVTQPQREW